MTKAFIFGSWEGFRTIGCYLKAFTGVLAIHRFDSRVGIFLLKRSKRFFWKLCPNLFVFIVYVTKKDSWSFKTNLFFTNWVPQESLVSNKGKQRDLKELDFWIPELFLLPCEEPSIASGGRWRKANWSQKTFSLLNNSQRVQYANHCWNNSESRPTVKIFERGNYL